MLFKRGMMVLALVCICNKCGHRDYRLYASQMLLSTLRSCSNRGFFSCYHCHEGRMAVKQLKYKESKKLRENFPNKKALFTTLDVDELLRLEKDLTSNPDVLKK